MKVQVAPFTPAVMNVQMVRPGMIIPGQPGKMIPVMSVQPGQMMPIQPIQPGQVIPMQPGQMIPMQPGNNGQMIPMQPGKPGQMMPGMTVIPVAYPMMRAPVQYPINQNQVYQGMPGFQPMVQPQPTKTNTGKSHVFYHTLLIKNTIHNCTPSSMSATFSQVF